MGFDEGDSGESAGEVTEQLGLHTWSRISGTSETEIKHGFIRHRGPSLASMNTAAQITLQYATPSFWANLLSVYVMLHNGTSTHSKQCSDRRSPSTLLALHATIKQKLYTFPSFAQLMVRIEKDNVYKPTNHVNNAQYKNVCVVNKCKISSTFSSYSVHPCKPEPL